MDDTSRFAFGANWRRFLEQLNEQRIAAAVNSLQLGFGVDSLAGRSFLDIGSGSGLFSLAAHRLGARVHSFDYDEQSVACTQLLRERFGSGEHNDFESPAEPSRTSPGWHIEQGSVLDEGYLAALGQFDDVYSWGVLHHTGKMWRAIERAAERVRPGGKFWIAIYNHQGVVTALWRRVKHIYHALPRWLRPLWVLIIGGLLAAKKIGRTLAVFLARLLMFQNPFGHDQPEWPGPMSTSARGMHYWYDLVDWVGGLPFEVATPAEIVDFLTPRGFTLTRIATVGGKLGCNEFVFQRHRECSNSQS